MDLDLVSIQKLVAANHPTDADFLLKLIRCVVLTCAQMTGTTPAQARTIFLNIWSSMPENGGSPP